MICRIYTLLYGIKLYTKLTKVFCCGQSGIYGNDIGKAKYLLFSQIKTLPLEALKKQLYISAKFVKSRIVIMIGIIMCLSLTGENNRGTIDIAIWW